MKLFLSVLSLFYMGSIPGRGAVISPSGVIWYVRPSQAAACDRLHDRLINLTPLFTPTWFSDAFIALFDTHVTF